MTTFALLPFLKTKTPVRIGSLAFRSTNDPGDLVADEVRQLREVAGMLFLKDDLQIQNCSFAAVPDIDLELLSDDQLLPLADAQAAIAYLYSSRVQASGELFLSSEHASIVLLTPGKVSKFAARPAHHVNDLGKALVPDHRNEVDGYHGLVDFRHHFWATEGSRIYGSLPHATMNIAQDLSADVERLPLFRPDYKLLFALLDRPRSDASTRVLTSVRWYNKANRECNQESDSLVFLSIAFETLLRLPTDTKTNRFVDTVSLLLGRLPRLDEWARQFYAERSRVVHEGQTAQTRFRVSDRSGKRTFQEYQPLLAYGRQVFQLCVGTLLQGLEMAENAGLEESLITNQERFELLCKILSDEQLSGDDRLSKASPVMSSAMRFRFVAESNLKLETMLGACRRAAKATLDSSFELRSGLRDALDSFASSSQTPDHLDELRDLELLCDALTDDDLQDRYISEDVPAATTALRLIRSVWLEVCMHFFWLKEERERSGP